MKKIVWIFFVSCLVSFIYAAGARAEDPEAARLIKEIKAKGAKAVMAELIHNDDWSEFKKVCDKIETGKQEWLEVAKLLMPGTDGAATEDLGYSVALALPKAPRRVLALILETEHDPRWGFTVDNTCISPFIEPEPGVAEKHLMETENALESTNTHGWRKLDNLRLKCLKSIQKDISYSKAHGLWHPKP
jgi:hypothetical protein